jgi:hypothetical protein
MFDCIDLVMRKLQDGKEACLKAQVADPHMRDVYKQAARLAYREAREMRMASQIHMPQMKLLLALFAVAQGSQTRRA